MAHIGTFKEIGNGFEGEVFIPRSPTKGVRIVLEQPHQQEGAHPSDFRGPIGLCGVVRYAEWRLLRQVFCVSRHDLLRIIPDESRDAGGAAALWASDQRDQTSE